MCKSNEITKFEIHEGKKKTLSPLLWPLAVYCMVLLIVAPFSREKMSQARNALASHWAVEYGDNNDDGGIVGKENGFCARLLHSRLSIVSIDMLLLQNDGRSALFAPRRSFDFPTTLPKIKREMSFEVLKHSIIATFLTPYPPSPFPPLNTHTDPPARSQRW